jgi:hypothetical protein
MHTLLGFLDRAKLTFSKGPNRVFPSARLKTYTDLVSEILFSSYLEF